MIMARATVHKDLIYRHWNAEHGGVYVPVTDKTQPNIYLNDPARDVKTTEGKRLTKVNPSYMTRQVFKMDVGESNLNSRLISINPLNPDNIPDDWEIIAFKKIGKNLTDYSSITLQENKKTFRYLKPLAIEKQCLSCHAEQGYKIGDIKGAISISIPMTPMYNENKSHYITMMGGFFALWLCGVIGLLFFFHRMNVAFYRLSDAENELSESRERHKLLFEKAQDAIFILEGEGQNTGKIIEANPAAATMHGYTLEELLNLKINDLDEPDAADMVQQRIKTMLNGHWITAELDHVKKDGTVFPVEISAGLFEHKGKKYIFAIDRDISDRQRIEDEKAVVEEQLRQVQKMDALGQLSGGIAHDFNNILSIIVGYTELSMDFAKDQSVLKHNLLQILKSSLRATDLVKQILAFSRQDSTAFKTIDFKSILEEALSLLKAVIPSTINVKFTISDKLFYIIGNATQLHQVIVNIITNAMHALDDKTGNIDIFLDHEKACTEMPDSIDSNCLMFTVLDSGKGIAETEIDKIFNPYYTTKEVGKGTGLGLSVVYGIVKSHKGTINVESIINKGTSFEIRLPLASTIENEENILNKETLKGGSESIMIVDDEKDILELSQTFLEKIGYTVECVDNSRTALELFRMYPKKYDLVITDMTMPHMNGLILAKQLRDIRHDITIILCSGNKQEALSKYDIKDLINTILTKPISRKVFSETIRKLLDQKRS